MKPIVFLAVSLLLLPHCQKVPASAEQVARDFVESYYVEINLAQALTYTEGLAADRVNMSLQLTHGQAPDATALKPQVSTKLLTKEADALGDRYLFQLQIRPKNFEPFQRKIMVRVQPVGSGWKVAQFVDE